MKKILLLLSFFVIASNSMAASIGDIKLNQFEREKLKENQFRFTSPREDLKIHIQTNEFEKLWDERTLDADLKEMFRRRKSMYELMGFSDVNFTEQKLSKRSQRQMLLIKGEYKNPEDKLIHFAEINIYFSKKFLQIKLINEKNPIKDQTIEEIIKQIPIDDLGI